MRSAEQIAGRMKSALAEWAEMAGDSLPERRSIRNFVQDNAVVLGLAGAGLGALIGAAIAGGMRDYGSRDFGSSRRDDFSSGMDE